MHSKAKTILTSAKTKNSFETKRLLVRPLNSQDKALFVEMHTNEKIMKYTGGAVSSEAAHAKFVTSLRLNQIKGIQFKTWTIVSLQSNSPIGFQVLYKTDELPNDQAVEIGIMIARHAQGKQIPEEAMGGLMQFAFSYLNIEKIIARFSKQNIATKRFVKKLGFVFDDNLEEDDSRYSYFDCQSWKKTIINNTFS
ncbi:GNAT family N-acetyltransferase [Thalassotalea euphylliae]|uniref:N-acetyltransferase n=1 Tax=Thalassotalea euphylliae TaxID=1655234 RepID=A0A3E0U035_9GAMM|nr:GNAT family N-acetyltransferase [Thalassotalea euphylliae]REL29997.1 N-acetyltransferase [Thalassotalea euphylliae]